MGVGEVGGEILGWEGGLGGGGGVKGGKGVGREGGGERGGKGMVFGGVDLDGEWGVVGVG